MNQTLYQKYRPYTFEQVIGQEYIKEILLKSIQNNKVQGTYLFNGPRGTGKTSIAKIFARAINCQSTDNPLEDDCEYCKYFESTSNYDDIFEIDAASNNGVDDIRQVIENVQYQPIHLKRKVYIIDEVHMLSKGAFNALLKTLEEPSDNSIFILATTEPGKIPATILSRCQRLDFKRIPDDVMNSHLKDILDKEKIKYEEETIQVITNLSDGCVRDALSLLQKLIMATDNLTLEYLQKSLGIAPEKQYEEITTYLIKKDLKALLLYWQEIYQSGINIENFIIDYQYYLKELIIKDKFTYNINQLINIIYKINDIEQRAVYTKNLSSLIEVCFIDIINNLDDSQNSNRTTSEIIINKEATNFKTELIDKVIPQAKEVEINSNIIGEVQIKQEQMNDYDQSVSKQYETIEYDNIQTQEKTIAKKKQQVVQVSKDISYVSEEVCYSVLNKATKEARIMCTKQFTKISDELTKDKKHGIAKFFIEGQIKAASEDELITVIDTDLVKPYLKRKDELLNKLPSINDIHIIDNKMWENVKVLYMNQQKEKKEKSKTVEVDIKEENVVKKLEEKLKIKVKTLEE